MWGGLRSTHLFIHFLWNQPHSLSKKFDLFYKPTLIFGFNTILHLLSPTTPHPGPSCTSFSSVYTVPGWPTPHATGSLDCWIQAGFPQWRALRSLDSDHLFPSPSLFGPGAPVGASSLLDDSSCFSVVSVPTVLLALWVMVASFWGYPYLTCVGSPFVKNSLFEHWSEFHFMPEFWPTIFKSLNYPPLESR